MEQHMGKNNRISMLIEYIPYTGGSINYAATSATLEGKGNNLTKITSDTGFNYPLAQVHSGGIKPFILGVSKLGTSGQGGDMFWGDPKKGDAQWDNNGRQIGGYYGGFWGKYEYRSDDNGNLETPLSFQIIAAGTIDHFVIRFDKILNEFATLISINNKDYQNSVGEFIWNGDKVNSFSVVIRKWNKPNKQVKITSILMGMAIEYDRKYFINGGGIKAGSRRTIDNAKPTYGVVSQYGDFQAMDINGNLDELNQLGLLVDGIRCGVFMDAEPYEDGEIFDTFIFNNKDKMLGSYRLAEISFIGDRVQAELVDDISNWQTIHFKGIASDINNTAYSLYTKLNAVTPDIVRSDTSVATYLKSINIPDGYLPPSMLSEAWNIFCNATLTKINKDTKGEIWLRI